MNKTILCIALSSACIVTTTSAVAALPAKTLLNFDAGVVTQNQYGQDIVLTGSYFAMGTNFPGTRTALVQNDGLFLGTSQTASGAHPGSPDGTETPGIDNAWEFTSATGLHFTVSPTTVSNATATGADIDFSGWRVTWSNVAEINMGAGGIATVVCTDALECGVGGGYTLDYATNVPLDSAVFPGTAYWLHLEGTVVDINEAPTAVLPTLATSVIPLGSVRIDAIGNTTDSTDSTGDDGIDTASVVVTAGAGSRNPILSLCTAGLTEHDLCEGEGDVIYTDTAGTDTVSADPFTYTVTDGLGKIIAVAVTVEVDVITGNQPPLCNDKTVLTNINTAIDIDVASSANDPDNSLGTGVAVNSVVTSIPQNGTPGTPTALGFVNFLPTPDSLLSGSFGYTVQDAEGAVCATAGTITININDLPVAVDDPAVVNRNSVSGVVIDVTANDTDTEDVTVDPTTVVIATDVTNGTTSVDPANGKVTYIPGTNHLGADFFTYTVKDLNGAESLPATVSITVNNNMPVAANDNGAVDTTLVSSISLDVTANDSDVDGDINRTTVVVTPASEVGGSTSVDPLTGVVTFTPTVGVFGNGGFTYTIADNDGGLSNIATVTINVPDPSIVGTGLPEDALLTFVLGTNTDTETPDPVDGDGSWFFMAGGAGFTAIESLNGIQVGTEQGASGSHSGEPGTGSTIEKPNIDSPWFFFNSTGMHQTTSAVTILSDDGAGNVTLDFSGWNVTWNGLASIPMGSGAHSGGTEGVAVMTCASACAVGDSYILNFYGTVPDGDPSSFGGVQYTVHLEGNITQGVIPTTAPVATGDAASVATGGSVTIDLNNNVFDKFGNPHTNIDFSTLLITHTTAGDNTVVDNGDGTVSYTDIDGVGASDSFTFKVSDNNGESTNSATVTINVTSGNLPPSASSFSVQVALDTATAIDVVSAVTDSDGIDATTVSASQSINGNGTTSVDPVTGVVTYTPNTGFVGSDSFTYSVKDNAGAGSNLATVNVFVNTAPLAVDIAASSDRNASVDIDVAFNATDADGSIDPATVNIVADVINGSTAIDAVTGLVTYTPDIGFLGVDSFSYEVNDDAGTTSNIATVTITVSNALPVAVDDAAGIDTATTLSVDVDVTANDTDADGAIDTTTVAIVTAATKGGTSIDPLTGVISYTPNSGFVGSDSFTYTVNDDDGGTSNEALVVVSISNSLGAVLPAGAFLTIVPATITSETIFDTPAVGEGSWFYMEVKPGALTHVSLQGFNQLQLGTSQLASDDAPDIDSAWTFFGNLGVHQTTSVVTILSDNGVGDVTLGLSGWDVSWNKIPSIPLNARANEAGFVDGVAIMTCAVDCFVGDTYILEYSATVPDGDVSGFGNVKYFLHLEGTILLDAPSIGGGDENAPSDVDESEAKNEDGSVITVVPGDTAASAGNTSGIHLTPEDIGLKDPLLNDKNGRQCIGGCIDFVVTGVTGAYADFVFKLNEVIPEGAAYRKLKNGVWQSFDESQGDLIGSAKSIAVDSATGLPIADNVVFDPAIHDKRCQGPDGVFEIGLRAGHMCLYMRIFDNGRNDADIIVGSITDPSGILLSGSPNTPAGSTSGCSISSTNVDMTERADWLIVVGFIVWLGLIGYRRKKAVN